MAVTVEKDIAQPVKTEADKSQQNLIKFEEKMKEYYQNMKKETFYQYATGVEDSKAKIEECNEKIVEFEKGLQDFEYFSKMFSFEEALIPA